MIDNKGTYYYQLDCHYHQNNRYQYKYRQPRSEDTIPVNHQPYNIYYPSLIVIISYSISLYISPSYYPIQVHFTLPSQNSISYHILLREESIIIDQTVTPPQQTLFKCVIIPFNLLCCH